MISNKNRPSSFEMLFFADNKIITDNKKTLNIHKNDLSLSPHLLLEEMLNASLKEVDSLWFFDNLFTIHLQEYPSSC